MPLVLALDQAPSGTGYCYGNGTAPPSHGFKEFPNFGDNEAALIRHVREWLTQFSKSAGVEIIVTEEVLAGHPVNVPVLIKKCCVYAAVASVAADLGIDDFAAPVSSWRSWFIGGAPPKGTRDGREWWKKKAILECTHRDLYPATDHAADAIGIWHWFMQHTDAQFRHRDRPNMRRAASRRDAERLSA